MERKGILKIFNYSHIQTRKNASSGLWMIGLIPVACSPGLYKEFINCHPSPAILSILSIQAGIIGLLSAISLGSKRSHVVKIVQKDIYRFLYSSYPVPILTSICLVILTDLIWFQSILYSFTAKELQERLTNWVFKNSPNSFSIGEGIFACQAASLFISMSFKGFFYSPKHYSEHQLVSSFNQIAVVTASVLVFAIWHLRHNLSMLKLSVLLLVTAVFGVCISSLVLQEWIFFWLLNFILSTPIRTALICWWINMSILIFFIPMAAKRYANMPQTVWRKVYHLILVLIMTPGIAMDPLLTHFATTGATIFFVLLEAIRSVNIHPVSNFLNDKFAFFLDEKDKGRLILSHIYLLVGLAAPLWLCPCSFTNLVKVTERASFRPKFFESLKYKKDIAVGPLAVQIAPVALFAGIIAVGIGDTFASIGGVYFGSRKWKGTKKTIQGTFFNILSQLLFVCLLVCFGVIHISYEYWAKIICTTVIISLLEAYTDQVDNIVLPLILYTPLIEP